MQTRWNTGRKYTNAGQLMAARFENGRVVFVDASRMVYGEYEARMPITGSFELQLDVMQHYDSHDYENCLAERGMVRYALGLDDKEAA